MSEYWRSMPNITQDTLDSFSSMDVEELMSNWEKRWEELLASRSGFTRLDAVVDFALRGISETLGVDKKLLKESSYPVMILALKLVERQLRSEEMKRKYETG